MRRRIIDFDAPDRLVAGIVPGRDDEVIVLQAARAGRVVSVALEREQLGLLADRTLVILDELERRGLVAIDAGLSRAADEQRLDEPVREEFRAGMLTIAWDDDGDRVDIEAHAMAFEAGAGESAARPGGGLEEEVPDDEPMAPDVLRVRLAPVAAQRFARHAGQIASRR
jgi:uncharacterized repeat protein (TIGR03847 family)